MISKLVLGAITAAVLAALVISPAMATGPASWQHVVSSSVTAKNGQTSTLGVVAADNIPRHTDVLGGFAWVYASGSPNTVFVAVTHNGVRDSTQNPDGWHTHNVNLAFGASPGSNACITGLADTNAGLSIQGNTLSVNVRNSELTGSLTNSAVAFTIVADPGCAGTGLGVDLS
ncbi:MAG TPA: hypothetical protein VJ792_06365 [Candidatus Nitrosotalea sp.]|nr:hypothetical protein [Candidatus Nitrosotalea sp.]